MRSNLQNLKDKTIMNILGDIGNSETKIFLVDSKNKIKKSISFSSKKKRVHKKKREKNASEVFLVKTFTSFFAVVI